MKPIIQVAGIKSLKEAEMVFSAGARWVGFPLRLDVNKPDLTESEAAEVIRSIKPKCKPVLITYLEDAKEIVDFMSYLGTLYVQLHGSIKLEELKVLRRSNKNLFIIKSLVVRSNNEDQLAKDVERYTPFVDAFITDTYDPTTGASGATGKTHDWQISKMLVEISSRPVILAGGLNPKNVRDAILTVKPAGVDSHTGVENKNGDKDEKLVRAFIENSKSAYAELYH